MATSVTLYALAYETKESRHIWVLTNWELPAGKAAYLVRRIDDLNGNFVELVFQIDDGEDQNLKIFSRADLKNPISTLDPAHQVKISAYENGQLTASDSMDTGNAHHN